MLPGGKSLEVNLRENSLAEMQNVLLVLYPQSIIWTKDNGEAGYAVSKYCKLNRWEARFPSILTMT